MSLCNLKSCFRLFCCGAGIFVSSACVKDKAPEDPDSFQREIVASMTHLAVELVLADGLIHEKERQFFDRGAFTGVDPLQLSKMNSSRSRAVLRFMPEEVHQGLMKQLKEIADLDDELHPAEDKLLKEVQSTLSLPRKPSKALRLLELRAKRSEVPAVLFALKNAEFSFARKNKIYVAAEPYPPPTSQGLRSWSREESGGFKELDWQPDRDIMGTYWIESDEAEFRITGIIDTDGDGVFATYVATDKEKPAAVTEDDIY